MVTNKELNDFIKINFEGRENLDLELVRDILEISKIYDRNHERRREARKLSQDSKVNTFSKIEGLLNRLGEIMRDAAGIRTRGPSKNQHKSLPSMREKE